MKVLGAGDNKTQLQGAALYVQVTPLENKTWCPRQMWGHTSLIPALRRQRQEDLCEFKACLVYRASSRTAKAVTQRTLSWKNQNEKKTKQKQDKVKIFGRICFEMFSGEMWKSLVYFIHSDLDSSYISKEDLGSS